MMENLVRTNRTVSRAIEICSDQKLSRPHDVTFDSEAAGEVACMAFRSLDIKTSDVLSYSLDFGDERWHQIEVAVIGEDAPRRGDAGGTKRIGKSPSLDVD